MNPSPPENPSNAQRIQVLEHSKRLLKMQLDQIHADEQRLIEERGRLWCEMQKIDNELASIVNSHLVDA